MKDFDRMYNEFFGDDEDNKPRFSKEDERMFNLVDRLNTEALEDGVLEDETLGEPTSRKIVLIEGVKFEETIWATKNGSVIRMQPLEPKIIDMKNLGELGGILNGFFEKVETLKQKTPEELLNEALENEDYEEAAKLRDIINGENEKNIEKKETPKTPTNKGLPEDEDWNF